MTRGALGLNGLNFFTASVQTGFGPFITVWLAQQGWDFGDIGLALSIGTIAGLAAQLPGGLLVDHIHAKRGVAAGGLIVMGLGASLMALPPTTLVVWASQIVHGLASCVVTPVIASLTLAFCGHAAFSQRLGVNARYAALGSAGAAAVLGGIASFTSERSVFILTAVLVLPALGSLLLIRPADNLPPEDQHKALTHPKQREHPFWRIFADPPLHMFAISVLMFQIANAAMLPLALSNLTQRGGTPGWVVSASIVLPQLITAVLSPRAGGLAQRLGRRPVMLAGFAAVPARALLFATLPSALPLVGYEVLDGISGTVLGLMIPLIAADLTVGTGYLNLAIGALGLASGLGATFSTTIAGLLADSIDTRVAFLALAAAGGAATLLLAVLMPETRPVTDGSPSEATHQSVRAR